MPSKFCSHFWILKLHNNLINFEQLKVSNFTKVALFIQIAVKTSQMLLFSKLFILQAPLDIFVTTSSFPFLQRSTTSLTYSEVNCPERLESDA